MDNLNNKNKGVENRLKRVERWLRRCVAAYRGGSWYDALSEAECLEAEAKGLREKLWLKAEDDAVGADKTRSGARVVSLLKVVTLAMVMVLTAVLPISDMGPMSRDMAYAPETFEFLTSPESDIIDALRESLSSGNRGAAVLTAEKPAKKSGAAMASEPAPAEIEAVPETAGEMKEIIAESPRRPSADEVIALIQVGQRALRASEPGIRIEM